MTITFSLLAQEEQAEADTLFINVDSLSLDAVAPQYMRVSSNAIDKQVTYSSSGQVRRDIANQRVTLTNKAVIRYGDTEVQADSIVFDFVTNQLFAIGLTDSTGKVTGKPVFKDGSQVFDSDMLLYNFQTKQAFVKNIITKQDEGLIRSAYAKLLEDGTFNVARNTYSTCDADPPHFYINMPKARVYPGEKIVSGHGNLVVEGIPLPLVIPFGYFPINTDRSSSGIMFPTYGQERNRGYSLTNMGYYFSINDYIDLSVRGDVYTNGEWRANVESRYIKLYKYSGSLNFTYAKNIMGIKGLPGRSESTNYSLAWSYRQDPKASPESSFGANVSMSSASFAHLNSYDYQERAATNQTSNINYSKRWAGTPFSFSTSMSHNQNNKAKTVDLNLPKASFTMSRIYPLKMGKQKSGTKWYQDLQFQYSAALDNKINTTDSLFFKPQMFDNMKNGFEHRAPLSLQIRPFKNFSVSPSLTYTGVLYTQKIEKYWNANTEKVVNDTIRGAFYGHALNPTISASYSPQLFGTYAFINPDAHRIQAVRHVIRPSIGFNFTPDHNLSSNMFRTVQNAPTDSLGRRKYSEYSIFEGGIYGTPRISGKSGSVSFNLGNVLEAKVFSKNDTTGIPKKVKLIESLNTGISYNIFADSMRWSGVPISARTTLFENVSISASSNFSIYAIDSNGKPINQLYYKTNGKPLRFIDFRTSIDFSLDRLLKGKDGNQPQSGTNTALSSSRAGFDDDQHDHPVNNIYGYQPFDMPWTLNVSYTLDYKKQLQGSNFTQGLQMNGGVTITKNMRATVNTGYSFEYKQFTSTQIGIQRELHCWDMNFNWSPIGPWQFWNFTIRAKASILRDLKYDRKKSPFDNF